MSVFEKAHEMGSWVKPENLYVVKRANIEYNQYWSDEKKKFGPLLEATVYTEMPSNIENGEIVDYNKVIGLK